MAAAGGRGASTIKVDGLRRLRADLRKMGEDTQDLKDANAAVAALVASAAAVRAPRGKTGRLAGSGRGNRAVGKATVTFGGAAVPYAGPIHWGWPARNIKAQPWLYDAAVASQNQWTGQYARALQDIIDAVEGAPGP
jgi:hypothetical protein